MCTNSEDNVENVVKPPNTPMTKNGFTHSVCIDIPIIQPINKLPMILTIGVAIGNFELKLCVK